MNGRRDGNAPFRCGTSVTYSCDSGFELRGAPTILCLSIGDWTAPSPTCESTSDPNTGSIF